ncbi:TPA: hypothetical protein NGR52_004198 [Vibrio parahaemolyticus]|nr:hypothetical protein [Vibrio parahaemolyticus]
MNLETAHRELETLMQSLNLPVEVLYENIGDYSFSDLPENIFQGENNFIRFGVEIANSQRLELNPNPASKESGAILIDIYLLKGTGVRELYKLLDLLDEQFKHNDLLGIELRERTKIGNFKIGKWVLYSYQYSFYFCN